MDISYLKPLCRFSNGDFTYDELCRNAYEKGWLRAYYKQESKNPYSDKELFDLYEFGYEDASIGEYNFE